MKDSIMGRQRRSRVRRSLADRRTPGTDRLWEMRPAAQQVLSVQFAYGFVTACNDLHMQTCVSSCVCRSPHRVRKGIQTRFQNGKISLVMLATSCSRSLRQYAHSKGALTTLHEAALWDGQRSRFDTYTKRSLPAEALPAIYFFALGTALA